MESHKIQITISELEQPCLVEYLKQEPSARKRANIIKRLAELGATAEKIGLTRLTTGSLMTVHPSIEQAGAREQSGLADAHLGGDFFENALSDLMQSRSQRSDNGPVAASESQKR
jgi:hypothetical protein